MPVVAVLAAVAAVWCWPAGRALTDTWSSDRADADPSVADRRGWSAGMSPPAKRGLVRSPDVAVAMDLLALVAASGRGVLEAMDRVAVVSPSHVHADLATVVAAQGWGVDAREAWRLVGPVWEPAATALALASTAGLAPSGILVRAAADIRFAHAEALDLAAARLGVRLVLPLGLAFLPAFVLLTVVPLVVALATQLLG